MISQFKTFLIVTVFSWYGMMIFHEAGHVAVALFSGAEIIRVQIPLLGFSYTEIGANPNPLWTAWAGPIGGVSSALLLLLMTTGSRRRVRHIALYFSGFSCIANGLYLGVGMFDRVGDCADLLRNGAEPWQLVLFGVASCLLGFICWHRMGPIRRLFADSEEKQE
tara:strand:- start:277 stop:771 length:495 start_codon:yes stop_codon:yes gene_type:complete